MSAMQRRKGQSGEREFFGLLSEHLGFVVRRNVDQARRGGADGIEVPGWAIEVKRHESGFREAWWVQALHQSTVSRRPALAYRASRQPWRVRLYVHDFIIAMSDTWRGPYGDMWIECDVKTFAFIVRESLPKQEQAA